VKTPASGETGFAALRYPGFLIFIVGKVLSVVSNHMILVALAYQIYDRTGDPLNLAMINLSLFVPTCGLSLFIGYVVDRYNRKRVMTLVFTALTITTLFILAFTVFDIQVLWPYYVVLFCMGTARAFYGPTSNAIAPNLVPLEVFPNSVAWNASTGKIAQICGPAAGGFLYLAGPEVVYATAAVTFILAAITTTMIRFYTVPDRQKGRPTARSLLAGLAFVFEKKVVLGAVVVDLFVALMGGVVALLPIFAKDILDVGSAGAGVLRSSIAVGGLVAALILIRLPVRHAGRAMLIGVGIFGLGMVGFGLSTSFPLSIACLAIAGASDMMNVNLRQTLLQIATPDSLRGRVAAVNSVSANMGAELGGFRAGAFAAMMGAVPAVVVGGICVVVLALACPKLFPDLAKVERLDRAL
jgi:MFS family permease